MKYEGPLYGKIGRKVFDTGRTSADWDRMENAIKEALMHLNTNYCIDGHRMSESDAARALRRGLPNALPNPSCEGRPSKPLTPTQNA